MDFWCVTPKPNTHLRCDKVNGIFGDRVRGSLKKSPWVNDETKKSTEKKKKRVNYPKPGLAFAVLTSNNTAKEALWQTKTVTKFQRRRAETKNVAAIILGGGAGDDLFPLTLRTATPAVRLGGSYRIIDIPMSNCLNSGVDKIFVLTQFNSASLHRHVARTYTGNGRGITFGDGFVEILAATQTNGKNGMEWFQGTADAVRQFTWVLEDSKSRNIENVLVLSGDHLYRMDYMKFVQSHVDNKADITLSCAPVDESRASDYGLVKIDSRGQIFHFSEKPKGVNLKAMQTDTSLLGLSKQDSMKFPYVASMGVYVFKTEILLKLLRWRYPSSNDFGSEIIPEAVKDYDVQAYMFRDYWEDIGTIKTFYEANLGLTVQVPKFEFYDPDTPFFTYPRNLPPTKIDRCRVVESTISDGCFIRECRIQHSIVGIRSRLDFGVELTDTIMMGADYYQTEEEIKSLLDEGKVPMGIGQNSKIRKCIIEVNANIGKNVIIMNKDGVEEADRPEEGFYIRSGIVIVLEKATIEDGKII